MLRPPGGADGGSQLTVTWLDVADVAERLVVAARWALPLAVKWAATRAVESADGYTAASSMDPLNQVHPYQVSRPISSPLRSTLVFKSVVNFWLPKLCPSR